MDISEYIESQTVEDQKVCKLLRNIISNGLVNAESKIWHKHPVWFLNDNPTVGFSKQKAGIRLMFWSGADFDEDMLKPGSGKFKDASVFYTASNEIVEEDVKRWLEKATQIQWDYKNLVKKKGILERLL